MNKRLSILMGVLLILIGGLALAFNVVVPWWAPEFWRWGSWRLWPLLIVGGGLLFTVSPLLVRGKRGLGGLYIPGVPILVTGGILLFASMFDAWGAWAWLWPLEVLGLALGFLVAAIYMRAIWLLLPAILIGANGLIFQFCALTGRWDTWAVLWAFEPLSLGLAFLIINVKQRSKELFVAGLILCVLAALGLMGMSALFPGWLLINLVGAATLVLAGLLIIVFNVVRRSPQPDQVDAEAPAEQVHMAPGAEYVSAETEAEQVDTETEVEQTDVAAEAEQVNAETEAE
jgi:hypothetical protein